MCPKNSEYVFGRMLRMDLPGTECHNFILCFQIFFFFLSCRLFTFFTAVFSPSCTTVTEDGWTVVVNVGRSETGNMDPLKDDMKTMVKGEEDEDYRGDVGERLAKVTP